MSLWPLAAAMLAAFLAVSTLRVRRTDNPTIVFFFLLNTATMLWSFFYAVELNLDTTVALDVVPIGSPEYLVYVAEIIGLAAAPVYWYLFAAAYSRRTQLIEGWPLVAAHVLLAYTVVAAATNPLHQQFVSQAGPGEPVGYGPLAYPHQLITFSLVAVGTWWIVGRIWRARARRERTQALALAGAAALPFVGGILWAVRMPLGLPLNVNPVPVLFAVLNLVLLYQVLGKGLADIVPVAAAQVFKTMSDAAIVVNEAGVIMALNPAAERLLSDAEPGTLLGHASDEIGEHAEDFLIKCEEFHEFEYTAGERLYWGRIRRTRERKGHPVGYVIMLTDATELRQAEFELAKANHTLEQRVRELAEARRRAEERGRELADANSRLAEATRAKSRFLASVSHELRTPLNSIIGFSGIMLQGSAGELTEEQRKQLGMIKNSGRRLLDLINDVLDLSRIEANKIELRFEPVDARAVVEGLANHIEPMCRDAGLTLTMLWAVDDLVLITDATRLEQILLNLLTNAVKFTDKGGITIEVLVDGPSVEFRVSDTGIGIPEEALDRIFAEFEQAEQTAAQGRPGTGLGLSISHRFAMMLGGSLSVKSKVGVGSTFVLRLPIQ